MRHFCRSLLAAALLSCVCLQASAQHIVVGTITDARGKPLDGVTVSAKAIGTTITTTVYTDARGRYYFPKLESARYRVWAQALSYATARTEVDLKTAQRADFSLQPLQDYFAQLPGDAVMASLPEASVEDKKLKQVFRNGCTGCHPASYVLQHRFDEAGWNAIIELMKNVGPPGNYKGPEHKPNGILDFYQKRLAAYLANARGPGESSLKITSRPRPTDEAARVVYQEYAVPLDPALGLPYEFPLTDGSDWSQGTPSELQGVFGLHDVAADLDGNLWFTYVLPTPTMSIGRIDARTGKVKYFKLDGAHGLALGTHGIVRDAQGALWFTVFGKENVMRGTLARIDPRTEAIEVFAPPKEMSGVGGAPTIDVDAHGKVWVSAPDGVLRFDPDTRTFKEFKSSRFKRAKGLNLSYGVAGDRLGNGWWLQMNYDIVGHADAATGRATEIQMQPLAPMQQLFTAEDERKVFDAFDQLSFDSLYPWSQGSRRMGADKNGDAVWVNNCLGGNVARIDIKTLKVTYIPTPDPQTLQPYQSVVDSAHDVWTNMWTTDAFLKYDPKKERWTVFDLPTRGTEARHIAATEHTGKVQVIVPYWRTRKVAVMTPRSAAEIEALRKEAQRAGF